MNLDEYQEHALKTWLCIDIKTFDKIMGLTLGIAGEAGEIADKVKKIYRDKGHIQAVVSDEDREYLKKEIGDVLWYLAVLSHAIGLKFSDVGKYNIEKLASRKKRGVLTGSGDNR